MKKLLFIIGLFCCTISNLYAIDGAELTYKCQGNNTYLVTLKVYLDCTSTIPMNNSTIVSCGSTSTNYATTATLQLINSYEQSQICPSNSSLSTCNGGNIPSEKVYIYQGTLTLPVSAPDWIVSWTSYYLNFNSNPWNTIRERNTNIGNIFVPSYPGHVSSLFIEAGINSTICYDSPTFESETNLYYPSYFNVNSAPYFKNHYNAGAIAPKGCDLTYSLSCAQHGNSMSILGVNYYKSCYSFFLGNNNLSVTEPIYTGPNRIFNLDASTGQFSFTLANYQDQNSALAMTVHLIKDGDTIGFVQKDFIIRALHNSIFKPMHTDNFEVLYGEYDTLTSSFYMCAGLNMSIFELISHNINGDSIQADFVNTNLNSVIGSGAYSLILQNTAPYQIDSAKVYLQLNPPTLPSIGRHPFTVGIKTSACPFNNKHIMGYNLVVGGARAYTPTPIICPSVSQSVQLNASTYEPSGIANTGTYNWTQIGGPNVVFSDTSITNPTIITPFLLGDTDSIVLVLEYTSAPYPNTNIVCNTFDTLVIRYESSNTCRYLKAVEGHVLNDANNNCTLDGADTLANNVNLAAFIKGTDTIYVSTDLATGLFEAHLDTGLYTVSIVPPRPYWTACPASQSVLIDTSYTLQSLDFVLQANTVCPALEVSISAPRLRRCFPNPIYVNYCNTGTILATNAYVEVELDTTLYYISSSVPFSSQSGNIYRFNVGNLGVEQCGNFSIIAEVSCNSSLGAIHCMEAHIYPDSICDVDLPNLLITDSCTIDSVQFRITNLSTPYLSTSYWLLEDSVIVDTGSITVAIGSNLIIAYPSSNPHSDYQLLIAPNTSDLLMVSRLGNCSGMLNAPPLYSPFPNIPYISSVCQSNRGSYDPNDKQGTPLGLGSLHYILPNVALDYRIRFQNTGTDTAIFINILDTLSSNLDVSTLQMGASSHPFTWSLMPHSSLGLDILKITFDPIYLPDSTTNLNASNGFVNYSIQQKPNLSNFTTIENSASIYFDYNAPIKTNTTLHTICDDCLPIIPLITNNKNIENKGFNSIIYPNPTSDLLHIKTTTSLQTNISIINSLGQVLVQQQLSNFMTSINIKSLPSGIYHIILTNGLEKETHKMVKY